LPSIPPAGVPVSSYPKFNRTPTQLQIVEKLKEAQRLLEEETRHRQIAVDYVETKAMFFGAKVAITNVLHEICVKYQLYGVVTDGQAEWPRQGGTLLVWQGAKADDERITGAIDDLLTNETPTDGAGNALPSLADIHKVARDQLTILFVNIIKYHELQIERSFVLDQIAVLCIKSILLGEAPTPEVISILNDKDLGPALDFPFRTDGSISSFTDTIMNPAYGMSGHYGLQPTPIIDQWLTGQEYKATQRKPRDKFDAHRGNLRLKYVEKPFGDVRIFNGINGNYPDSGQNGVLNHNLAFVNQGMFTKNKPSQNYLATLERELGLMRVKNIPLNFKKVPSAPDVYYATDTLISFYSHSLKTRKPEDFWAFCSRYRLVGELGGSGFQSPFKGVLIRLVEVDPKTSAPKGRGTIAGIMTATSYSQAESELGNAVSAVASMYHYILPLVKGEVITTSASNMQNYLEPQTKQAQSMWVGIPNKAAQPYVAIVREKWNWPDSFLQREKTGQWSNEFKPTSISLSWRRNSDYLQWASNDPKKRSLAINDPTGNQRLPESMLPLVFGPAKDIPGVNSITQIDFMLQPAGALDAMRSIATPGVNNPVMQAIKDVFFKGDIVEDTGESFKVNIIQQGTTTSFEQKMLQVKKNLEVLQIVLTSPYLYLEGRDRALVPTSSNSDRSRYGICVSQAEMNFVKSVLDKARWPKGVPKVLYSTPVDDVADIPLATARMKSALSSTTSSPPKLAPLAELPPLNLQTVPSVDDNGNQYVTLTMRNGRGFPLPPLSEDLPRTLIYSEERSGNGLHEMYTTFNYIWSRDAVGIYTGAKSKIKGTLPDVEISRKITPQQQELQNIQKEKKQNDVDVAAIVSVSAIVGAGVLLFARERGFFDGRE
tara:strand:- start:856 stop:3507 length:2652 start_codon:yes stop_codon:yes gene_type:complete